MYITLIKPTILDFLKDTVNTGRESMGALEFTTSEDVYSSVSFEKLIYLVEEMNITEVSFK